MGTAVLPRIHVTRARDELPLRAFLDHPLVIYGHHQDVKDGLELLADLAERVRELGDVQWIAPEAIARSNVAWRRIGTRFEVLMYSRRVDVVVPEDVDEIVIRTADPPGAALDYAVRLDGVGERWRLGEAITARPGPLSVQLDVSDGVDAEQLPAPPRHAWPIARRVLAEARDRMAALRG